MMEVRKPIPQIYTGSQRDIGGYKLPLHVACGASIVGHILYACAYRANFLYLILIGRIVSGLAFAFWMYCKRYCSDARIVGIRKRTTLASLLVMGQGLGMSLGPFAGGLLHKVGFENRVFNGFTSPGWIMAGVWAVFWVFVTLYFEDVPQDIPINEPQPIQDKDESGVIIRDSQDNESFSSTSTHFDMTLQQWGVIVCMCWFAMTCFFILGAWESNLPVYGSLAHELRWSPFAAGNFIALGGITALPFLVLNFFLARRIQDRYILAFGSFLGLAALFVFLALLETNKVTYPGIFMCWWAIAVGFNMATVAPVSLLSKQLPPSWNGRTSLIIQYSFFTGRVTGAIWGGAGAKIGMSRYVGLEIAYVGIGAILFVAFWRDLKAKKG